MGEACWQRFGETENSGWDSEGVKNEDNGLYRWSYIVGDDAMICSI